MLMRIIFSPLVGPVALEPNATVFHFAHCLHEGMKAFRHSDGRISIFRPDMNMKRMNTSAQRIALPVGIHVAAGLLQTFLMYHYVFLDVQR